MPQIPLIDLSRVWENNPTQRLAAAKELQAACTDIGFFTITGHGVPLDLIDSLRSHARDFFRQPLATKLQAQATLRETPRGYKALGFDALSRGNADKAPGDLKEYFHFGRDSWPDTPYYNNEQGKKYFIPNIWPTYPAGWREAAQRYYQHMERLTSQLMSLAALALNLPEDFFEDKIDRHITAMRINYYPEQQQLHAQPGQLRAGAHTDYGLLTILNGENTPGGLEVQTRQGQWLPVQTDPGAFVVNIGDLLMRWTNDQWVSNMHRVVNPPAQSSTSAERISIAFFQHPNYDALVKCLAPEGQEKYPPIYSGEYRQQKYQQTRT